MGEVGFVLKIGFVLINPLLAMLRWVSRVHPAKPRPFKGAGLVVYILVVVLVALVVVIALVGIVLVVLFPKIV